MPIRFIIGRAGCGKTHRCVEAVRQRLRTDPIDGPRLVLLVPEQASLQMERTILAPSDIPGAHRCEVLSFRRLALRVLDHVGYSPRRALSEAGRSMVLRHLLGRQTTKLRYYTRVERFPGFIAELSDTVGELIQEAVSPEELLNSVGPSANDETAQAAKLHDIAGLYEAYLEYLAPDLLDPSQHLEVARALLSRCDWLDGAEIWVDGFASFSRQETLTLIALANQCSRMELTMLVDPALCIHGDATDASRGVADNRGADAFRRTAQSYRELEHEFARSGVPVDSPVVLMPDLPPRFVHSTALADLERTFVESGDRSDRAIYDTNDLGESDDLAVVTLASRRMEVEYAVAQIRRWVEDDPTEFRYRDVAIITRDLEPYHELLTASLTARGIPFFIDQRRSLAHHPLPELLRAMIALITEDFSIQAWRLLLKTGLPPIDMAAADELENYLLAHGIRGHAAWSGPEWSFVTRSGFVRDEDATNTPADEALLSCVNATRRSAGAWLDPWVTGAKAMALRSGADWVAVITKWLDRTGVGETIAEWAESAELDGELDHAAEHRQVWRNVLEFFEELAFAFADVELDVKQLGEVIDAGLTGLTLGLAPPMVDQVLVGSIERSRHPEIKAAVVIGFHDGMFPSVHTEQSILNDEDRTWLEEHGVKLKPPSADRVLEEELPAYVALTRASDRLVITRPAMDDGGKPLAPSPYLGRLRRRFGDAVFRELDEASSVRPLWNVLTTRDTADLIVAQMADRRETLRAPGQDRLRCNSLYVASRTELTADEASRRVLSALAPDTGASVSPATIARLKGRRFRASVSQLETYATCPFQHFAKYTLRLAERAESALAPVDVGQVHHAVLEDFVQGIARSGGNLSQLSESDALAKLEASCHYVADRLPGERIESSARDAYRLRRTASQLSRIISAQRRIAATGTARPRATELPFGYEDRPGLGALVLATPSGRRVELRGFIDRVDLAELGDELLGIVVDYKDTREKHLDLSQVYHGLSLQLPGYLLALSQMGESLAGRPIRPVAGLYVCLRASRTVVAHPDEISDRNRALPKTHRPRGLILSDAVDTLDPGGTTGWSDTYSLYRKSDGNLGNINSSDVADAGDFDRVLEHTKTRLGELADGILDGKIAVRPYRLGSFSPCSWCTMACVCRFEMGISDVRFLQKLSRTEVFARLANGDRTDAQNRTD